jgi:hypothetical protein
VIRERGLIHVRYPALCGLKPDIASGPKSANKGQSHPEFANAILSKADHAAINGFDFRR